MTTTTAEHPSAFKHQRVVFTGRLASMTRREAAEAVRRRGGHVSSSVSRRTTLVVVGVQGWPVLPDGSVSRSYLQAEAMQSRGTAVRIVSEDQFLERAGLRAAGSVSEKAFTLDDVCATLELDAGTVRRWESQGLVRSHAGRYDFRDLVSLRTIADLLGRGVGARTIATSINGLSRVLDTEQPLAQLKLVEESGSLLAEIGEAFVTPDGQFLLNFDPSREHATGSLSLPAARTADWTAHEWFEHAVAREELELFDEAIDAYRHALALEPETPEAHFNLGNVLRAVGRLEAAEEHLVLAVAQDPGFAMAWYNLADVQEEAGRVDEAIESLRNAVRVSPEYADAHYNLALFCEDAGRDDEARRHWEAYVRLDSDSPWADEARKRLAVSSSCSSRKS